MRQRCKGFVRQLWNGNRLPEVVWMERTWCGPDCRINKGRSSYSKIQNDKWRFSFFVRVYTLLCKLVGSAQ